MSDVNAAARHISDLLHDQGFAGTNRNDHLHQIAAIFANLDGNDANGVFDRLGSADRRSLGEQIDTHGIFGAQGLSEKERANLFDSMAQHADGKHLATLSGSLGREDQQALAGSVARFSTSQSKLDYTRGLAAGATRDNDAVDLAPYGTTITTGSPEAHAIGTVLGSMQGGYLNTALKALSDPQLGAVMRAGQNPAQTTTDSVVTNSHDARPLAAIVNATAHGTDMSQKVRVFQNAAQALTDIRGSDTLMTPNPTASAETGRVAGAMTNLLRSDTTGMVDHLNTADASGAALIAYARTMVKDKPGQQQLGGIIAQLREGNNLQADPANWINVHSKSGYYRHAENLGHFTGAVEEGLLQNAADANAQADVVRNIFGTASSVGRTFGPTAIKVAIPTLNGITQAGINAVVTRINGDGTRLRGAFFELALGQDGHGHRYRGPAEPSFTAGLVETAGPAAEVP